MKREPTVGDMMAAFANDAVDHARSAAGISLDYSSESIRDVEVVLESIHASLNGGLLGRLFGKGKSASYIDSMCKMYGGYVGEVFRRAGGGEWEWDTDTVPGEKLICLRKGGMKVWPPTKVFKRLTAGPEDNVRDYVNVIMKDWIR